MKIENTSFDPIATWDNELIHTNILTDVTCTNLFDQNGYHLTAAEQCYADVNGYPKQTRINFTEHILIILICLNENHMVELH